jgi:hypothetical protein
MATCTTFTKLAHYLQELIFLKNALGEFGNFGENHIMAFGKFEQLSHIS